MAVRSQGEMQQMPDCVEAGRVQEGRKGMPSMVEPAWKPGSRNPECIPARASRALNRAEKGNEWIGVAGVARPTAAHLKSQEQNINVKNCWAITKVS